MPHRPQQGADTYVAGLIRTALYDTGGQSVEGGFVDRWESNALVAIDELEDHFERRKFTPADEEQLRQALQDPGLPIDAAVTLLALLRRYTLPLIDELLTSKSVPARAAAIEAVARVRSPAEALPAFDDPNPVIRRAALRAAIGQRAKFAEADALFIRALADPEEEIRLLAARNVGLWKNPAGAEALLQHFEREPSPAVRNAIVAHVYELVRREGTHYSPSRLRGFVGEAIQEFLIRQLEHEDPRTRYEVARALERLACPDVGRVLLHRLSLEPDVVARRGLLFYPAFREIESEAFPVLSTLLASDPDVGIRTGAAFALDQFGERSVQSLVQALDDPHENVRRAAAMSLGRCNGGPALPLLLRELWDVRNWRSAREFESAVRDVAFYVPGPPPGAPDEALAAAIQDRIDALEAEAIISWPVRVCKESYNALPLHGSLIYIWCLQPDGTILCWDHEATRRDEEPETDARTRFAVMVHGAIKYPELTPLIPKLPENVRLCDYCHGRGWRDKGQGSEPCMNCNCLGWIERK